MTGRADREKIRQILTDTIISLCKNGISFNTELRVEALIGLTLDSSEVFLINIKETVALHEFVTPTPVVADNYSRSVTSSTVAKKCPQPQHEKIPTSQYPQAETQSMAEQPFFDRRSTSGFDNRLPTKSTSSSKVSEWQNSAGHQFKFDQDEVCKLDSWFCSNLFHCFKECSSRRICFTDQRYPSVLAIISVVLISLLVCYQIDKMRSTNIFIPSPNYASITIAISGAFVKLLIILLLVYLLFTLKSTIAILFLLISLLCKPIIFNLLSRLIHGLSPKLVFFIIYLQF